MTNLQLPNLNLGTLEALLGKRDVRKLGYKTIAYRNAPNDVQIIHHNSTIARIRMTHVYVHNGGWHSRTTADRLNRVLEDNKIPFGVAIRNGRMVLLDHANNWRESPLNSWAGFTLTPNGWELDK